MGILMEACLMFLTVMVIITIVGGTIVTLSWVVPALGELYLGVKATPPQVAASRSTPAVS